MGRIRRRFDAKFKQEICEAVMGGQSIGELCQDHQLHRGVVERWLEKYKQGEALSRPSAREKSLERQVEKLHAKIGQMAVEIDLLKKFHEMLRQRRSVDSSVITGKNLDRFRKLAEK
jgi:transposase